MENQKELRIFGTFGPTCHTREDIGNMLDAGMNGIRLNLSHSSIREHEDWMEEWKAACENTHHDCELILDLQGRERRLSGDFEPIELEEGDLISIPAQLPLGGDVLLFLETGDQLLLGDDDVPLHVEEKSGDGFVAKAMSKGRIHPGMNIHILGKDSDLPIVCARDLESLERGKQIGATGVMVPFVQNASDLRQIRKVVEPLIENCRIYAKIETMEGVHHIHEIMEEADEIVIARGDLAASCSMENLPAVQTVLEEACKERGKPYMMVTQVLTSMEHAPLPTRAEVSDLFNAIVRGASSVMLTGETAKSEYPVEAMTMCAQIAKQALEVKNHPERLKAYLDAQG